MMQARFLALPAVALLLSACASATGEYPSLAVRDAERWTGTMAVAEAEPYVPTPVGAPTIERVEHLTAEARAAHAQFLAGVGNARNHVSAASGVGSESWAVAQIAVADLESRRSRVMIALADLDRIYADTSSAAESIAPIADERDAIAALVTEENAVISELLARLPR